jgi:hypothetical protein
MRYLVYVFCLFITSNTISSCNKPAQLSQSINNLNEIQTERSILLNLVAGEWAAKSLYAAVELDIATHLSNGPQKIEALSKLACCHEESLYRLLSMLSKIGIFQEQSQNEFSNTKMSELLVKDHPSSLRSLILFYSHEMSQSWNQIVGCIEQGKPAFDLTFGSPVFSYFRTHPIQARSFNEAMKEKSIATIESVLRIFDFSKFESVCDIGGGIGHFLAAILHKYPNMRGILFEQPEVVEAALKTLAHLQNRSNCINGDFFQSIPENCDGYILKSILHDWNDEDALRILKNCYESMPPNSHILIIEPIVSSFNKNKLADIMDVYMMAITGGKERTIQSFSNLLELSGFEIKTTISTDTEFSIIDAVKQKKTGVGKR